MVRISKCPFWLKQIHRVKISYDKNSFILSLSAKMEMSYVKKKVNTSRQILERKRRWRFTNLGRKHVYASRNWPCGNVKFRNKAILTIRIKQIDAPPISLLQTLAEWCEFANLSRCELACLLWREKGKFRNVAHIKECAKRNHRALKCSICSDFSRGGVNLYFHHVLFV